VPNPLQNFDWNLRSCGLRGHVTYAPTEEALRDRLHVVTPAGEAWRCLRCGTYAVGAPNASGAADAAPRVLRGKALRDAFILRLLAVERGIRGLGLALIAIGILKFSSSHDVLQQMLDTYLPLVRPIADRVGYDLETSGVVRLIHEALNLKHTTVLWAAAGIGAYAALELVEAVGLWLMKRWGEYVAVVGTAVFIPLEVYELIDKASVLKAVALLVNVGAVVYILVTKRLFGLRGGHAAFEAERHGESLLEVEAAAAGEHPGRHHSPTP